MLGAPLARPDGTATASAPARQRTTVVRLWWGLLSGLGFGRIPAEALVFVRLWNSPGGRINRRDRVSNPDILSSARAPHRPPDHRDDQRGDEKKEGQPPVSPAPRPQHRSAIQTLIDLTPIGPPSPSPLLPAQPIPTIRTKVHGSSPPSLFQSFGYQRWRGGGVEGWRGGGGVPDPNRFKPDSSGRSTVKPLSYAITERWGGPDSLLFTEWGGGGCQVPPPEVPRGWIDKGKSVRRGRWAQSS